jgi:hypothetical protein
MIKQILAYFVVISLAIFLTSCFSSKEPEFYFEGDGQSLIIQEHEAPSDWYHNKEFSEPSQNGDGDWGVVYTPQPDQYGTQTTITQDVFVFQESETPIRHLEEYYEYYVDVSSPIVELPQKYNYRSPIADEFKVIYSPRKGWDGTIVGYNYHVIARYGNVISEFMTIVEDEEQTGIMAGDANVLPWSEVERLLKLIDEKFENAGFPQKRG